MPVQGVQQVQAGNSVQWVALEPRSLPFDEVAWFFRCACGARVTSIYLNDSRDAWGCRACLRLVYHSQKVHDLPT